jgi:hypothetical protein
MAAGKDGMRISPLVNTDYKALQIMPQQIKQVIAIIGGIAKHMLRHLHYVHKSAEEAAVHPTMTDGPFLGRVSVVHVLPPSC